MMLSFKDAEHFLFGQIFNLLCTRFLSSDKFFDRTLRFSALTLSEIVSWYFSIELYKYSMLVPIFNMIIG